MLNLRVNENTLYHQWMEFLIINHYESLTNLLVLEAEDFFYLIEVAATNELNKLIMIKSQMK